MINKMCAEASPIFLGIFNDLTFVCPSPITFASAQKVEKMLKEKGYILIDIKCLEVK